MKNRISLLVLIAGLFAGLQMNAQITPAWGYGPPTDDNTGRILTYGYNNNPNVVYATKDSNKLYPNYWDYIVQPSTAVADTITYVIPRKPPMLYTGTTMEFYGVAGASSNELLKFRSGVYANGINFHFITAADSTITLTASKRYYVSFKYDGTYFIETVKTIGQ